MFSYFHVPRLLRAGLPVGQYADISFTQWSKNVLQCEI